MSLAHPHNGRTASIRLFARATAVLVVFIMISVSLLAVFTRPVDAETVIRGVSASGIAIGGLSREKAATIIREATGRQRLSFRLGGASYVIDPHGIAGDRIATFDEDEAVTRALAVGRGADIVTAVIERISALGWGNDVVVPVTVHADVLRAAVAHAIGDEDSIARDAAFSITLPTPSSTEPRVTVIPERNGKMPDYARVTRDVTERLGELSTDAIVIHVRADLPKVLTADTEALVDEAKISVLRAPLSLTADDERWTVSRSTVADWIKPVFADGKVRVGIDREKVRTYLAARATSVTTTPKDASFEEKNGRVTVFVPGVNGRTLNIDDALDRIDAFFGATEEPASHAIELAIMPVPPEITTEASNPYGIKEIIGVGESNFQGSPKNRRHNIAVGSKAVNGTIVPAGEEFSMLKTLGEIDASTGYLEELVIKGNKTTPEFGGGLCQIGSTAFRGALDSGLLITQRQNHSYRVSYYERDGAGKYIGPGKDATIYDPAPDFRFKNDTSAGILIRTEIDGNTLRFVFWGARDGRTASQTDARVYNVVPPPEKKVTETDDLKPGEEKCTEKPHPGSDAVFTYTVKGADGVETKVDFKSHYRPWQEVCLVGRDPNKPLDTSVTDPGLISADASGAAGNPVTP